MALEIPSTTAGKMPNTINDSATLAKGLGLSSKAADIVKDIASLLGGKNVSVNTNEKVSNAETGKPTGSTGSPALDNPADLEQLEANLEKLISYLQMDNDERQTQMAKERIEIMKDSLETERNNRTEKIQKSLKEMEEAAKSRLASKIFGWLMTAIAVVAAVVACVATGGLAVGPVIAAGIAIACQVLNETGVMDKVVEKLAKALEDAGCSKMAAQILAQVIITVAIMAASIGTGFLGGGGAALSNALNGGAKTIEVVRAGLAIGSMILGIGGIGVGVGSAIENYQSGMSEADVKDTEKYIAALKQRLQECEEELEQVLQMLQKALSQIADILASQTNTADEIAKNSGQMA